MFDVMQNTVLGPLVREQIEIGIKAGLGESVGKEAKRVAIAVMCRRRVEQRYGPLPIWAEIRIIEAAAEKLIEWAVARDESESLESLIGLED